MSEYVIPKEYYFRIHHVRPRFKDDIESVLIYMAEKIEAIGEQERDDFVKNVNQAIRAYPGNATKKLKTINNWRTEISALFGFIEHTELTDKPGYRAIELSQHQDLVECFKIFLYNFQYPGAHIKPLGVLEQIRNGVHFKPAQYILRLLRYANAESKKTIGITKEEVCHCIFNDLRVIRDNEGEQKTWERIQKNRKDNLTYDQSGDVVRYAGDIVDYLEIANLLKTYDSHTYYLNTLEEETIIKFINSTEWFSKYDEMIADREGTLDEIKSYTNDWFSYVNRDIKNTDFSTDILTYIAKTEDELKLLKKNALIERSRVLNTRIEGELDAFTTKDIGDVGEYLVHGHECMRIKLAGREDLIHLIKKIPTSFNVGYDIQSVEVDERKRYIEVKTTISSKPLHFNHVHMTRNEWNTANTNRDRYYVYRLSLSKNEKKLFLLQDPVGLYKKDMIDMVPDNNGAEITFFPQKVGEFSELLTWKN